MDYPAALVLVVVACFLLAGGVKGLTGMGLPTVVMCTLVFVMPGSRAAALLVVPSLVTNFWQLFVGPGFGVVGRRLATMQICAFAGTFVGIGFLTGTPSPWSGLLSGAVLCAYAVLALAKVRFHVAPRLEIYLSPVIGLATGVLGGATGLFVVPTVPYLAALDFSGDQLIKALGFSFGVNTISLAIALGTRGAFDLEMAGASTLALLPAMAGMLLGERVRRSLRPETARRWFLIAVAAVGGVMMVKGVWWSVM